MSNLVNAYVIYNGTTNEFVGNNGQTVSINGDRLQAYSPRPVWLKRVLAAGDGTVVQYTPTFAPTSEELLDANTLTGLWIEQDFQDVMIDVTSVVAFQTAVNATPGTVPDIIDNRYGGNTPLFSSLTFNTFCVTRTDGGTAAAHYDFALDYGMNIVGNVRLRSNISNVSKYTVNSLWTLAQFTTKLKGTDTVANGVCP
jgi:hypothetical protein